MLDLVWRETKGCGGSPTGAQGKDSGHNLLRIPPVRCVPKNPFVWLSGRTVLPRASASDAKPKANPKSKASGKAAPKVKLVKDAAKKSDPVLETPQSKRKKG